MPLSFWFFLGVCIISFVPVIKDHGDSWREYKSGTGKARRNLGMQLFALWAIPIFTALGTVVTGFESVLSGRENAELHLQAGEAIKQAGLANERAATNELRASLIESNNLALRTNILALEAALQWRTITPTQKADLIGIFEASKPFLNQSGAMNTNEVPVRVSETDVEARWYAKRLVDLLKTCGFNAALRSGIGFSDPESPGPFVGLGCLVRDVKFENGQISMPPGNAGVIIGFFHVASIKITAIEMSTNVAAGDIEIFVGHKPEK